MGLFLFTEYLPPRLTWYCSPLPTLPFLTHTHVSVSRPCIAVVLVHQEIPLHGLRSHTTSACRRKCSQKMKILANPNFSNFKSSRKLREILETSLREEGDTTHQRLEDEQRLFVQEELAHRVSQECGGMLLIYSTVQILQLKHHIVLDSHTASNTMQDTHNTHVTSRVDSQHTYIYISLNVLYYSIHTRSFVYSPPLSTQCSLTASTHPSTLASITH